MDFESRVAKLFDSVGRDNPDSPGGKRKSGNITAEDVQGLMYDCTTELYFGRAPPTPEILEMAELINRGRTNVTIYI